MPAIQFPFHHRKTSLVKQAASYHLLLNVLAETETNRDGFIHTAHHALVQLAHSFEQPLFVNGTYLFQKYHAILCQTKGTRRQLNMRWQTRFVNLRT